MLRFPVPGGGSLSLVGAVVVRGNIITGSSYSGEASNVAQGPDNVFVANQAVNGMPIMGEPYTPGFPVPYMDNGYFSEAFFHFQGMMNPFLAFPPPPFGAAVPEPPPGRTMHPWIQETAPPYVEPTENGSAGPSTETQDTKLLSDHKTNSRKAKKRRRETETSDNDANNKKTAKKSKSSHKHKKRKKSKRRKE
ncbi:hypothetical protein GDO81_006914 [Engystomops pustulosus]|uniref:Uncharacterized protein n=1 Tax=Engystomops pustulosus TaxID=76066 RepID=A0AAV7D1V4_ENGPU|nr:hypothetical protein GDO81_006914 [Engystomops pustulosus]